MRLLRKILLGVVLTLVVGVCVAGIVAAWTREKELRANEASQLIRAPHGIQEDRYIPVGGTEQWIRIRGEDRANPVLLFIHGGPGASTTPLALPWRAWEKHFTVVQWDQRGTGNSFRRSGNSVHGTLTIERMSADGIEVADFIRRHLQKDKILLVCHSWGTVLGIHMIHERPDYFGAYVGTGQIVSTKENEDFNYRHVVALATKGQNQAALTALQKLGPPPWPTLEPVVQHREWAYRLYNGTGGDRLGPRMTFAMPGMSLLDYWYRRQGHLFTRAEMGVAPLDFNLRNVGMEFKIPMFFFEGSADPFTPIEPTEAFCSEITAPHKELVRFDGLHHFFVFNRADLFLAELLARVRPRL